MFSFVFFFSSRRRHTRCALVTGVQTCALPICSVRQPSLTSEPEFPRDPGSRCEPATECEKGRRRDPAPLASSVSRLRSDAATVTNRRLQIGRASCRERVCQYV